MADLLPFALFAFVSSVTPGPANVAILAKTSRTGFRASLPFVSGVLVGFLAVLVGGLGIYAAGVALTGTALIYLKVGGAAYLIYLAVGIWLDRARADESFVGMRGVLEGLPIHPLSVKAWLFVLLSYTTFKLDTSTLSVITYPLAFLLAAVAAHMIWMTLGSALKRQISTRYLQIINRISAVCIAALVIYIFLP
jgi:threonine/homoserine/homoserine lactone efflux protein